jgi:hypothetical protein
MTTSLGIDVIGNGRAGERHVKASAPTPSAGDPCLGRWPDRGVATDASSGCWEPC